MIILGIDPSLTGTGIAYGSETISIGSPPAGGELTDRVHRLGGIVHRIDQSVLGIEPYRFERKPDLVVIEAPAFSRTTGHHHDRSGLWWLIVKRLYDLEIPVVEVPPTVLKKFATGKGNATKPDMRMSLYQRAGLDVRDDNQVDAWWLRQIGMHLLANPGRLDLPKTHLAALAKIPTLEGTSS